MTARGDLTAALRELPLFPLHNAVLFPGSLMPLHIFEPRYRALVRDALTTHRALAMAHVPDPQADLGGNPPIAEIAGVGSIVEHQELSGGRYNIVLVGRGRVRLEELRFEPPYRRAIATLIETVGVTIPADEVAALQAAIHAFVALVTKRDRSFRLRIPQDADPAMIADSCAHQLVIAPTDRQRVLEAIDPCERVRLVTEMLTLQRASLSAERTPLN